MNILLIEDCGFSSKGKDVVLKFHPCDLDPGNSCRYMTVPATSLSILLIRCFSKLWLSIAESQSRIDTVPSQQIGNRLRVSYLLSGAGAGVVVVEVDSSFLMTTGASLGADGVTVVLDVDSLVCVVAGSSALLQPANKAKVAKPVAIIALVFIVVSS
jgi:hypothetical protein